MWICPKCGEQTPDSKDKCAFCDTLRTFHFDNYCINPKCKEYNVQLDDDRKTCNICGGLTKIGETIKSLS